MDWDWPAVVAIAQILATIILVAVAIYVSPNMQKWRKRNEPYNQLDTYDRDILKAIQESRLELGPIIVRIGDIEPIIERVSPRLNMAGDDGLIVGQGFYQLSLESLQSLTLLRKEDIISPHPHRIIGSSYENYDNHSDHRYRLTGAGKQFIKRYDKKLRRERYMGCVDLGPTEDRKERLVRREAQIRKEPPPFEHGPSSPFTTSFSWISILSDGNQRGSVGNLARMPGHGLGMEDGDTVYILVKSPIPQYPRKDVLSAKVLSFEECEAVDNRCLKVGEHTLIRIGHIQPWQRGEDRPRT